ncbi:non-ribosomal peptide synthetase [Mucilaginibacter sp. E4BP6]|uniref:non-ribosomal peptide synthetase n=1 Tax=Mucilaginibacter sp. E4BP6 TaxID=2723089 RepID=UPI0015CB2971|nr:non-ribosomal peptide synthetase [Mucilaginibacter sp. E4BP6]NYE68295.1 amino acid adenylation domain-containing protein [Mucilaginibacter sp. E4BP6]
MNTGYRLSDLQRRLWILWQLGEEDISYNSNSAVEFSGFFKVELVQRVFDTIIERHETLRTIFANVGDSPLQFVRKPEEIIFKVNYLDHTGITEDLLHLEIEKNFSSKFDLENGPLIKVDVLTIDSERFIMLVALHHIISDGWSIQNLAREFSILYNNYAKQLENPLLPLDFQFKDFVHAGTDLFVLNKNFWENKFAGEIPLLQLTLDRPRPSIKTYRGGRTFLNLSAQEKDYIRSFAGDNKVSLFVVLLSSLKVLLYRYTGQNDQIIGVPIANRSDERVESLIGCFVNTLLLRTCFDPQDNFYALTDIVNVNLLEAYDKCDYPFDKLIDDLKVDRDPSRSPLFDISVNFQESMIDNNDFEIGEVKMQGFETRHPLSKFDIEIDMVEFDQGIRINFTYNVDLFDEWRITKMTQDLRSIIFSAIDQPYLPVNEIDYISQSEQEMLLVKFNKTQVSLPQDNVVSLFERIVNQKNSSPAIKCQSETWTYKYLNDLSNAVAGYLLSRQSLLPGDKVAVCMRNDPWLFPLYLGILKAGGCFVPLNINYPQPELNKLIQQDGIALIIADGDFFEDAREISVPVKHLKKIKSEILQYVSFKIESEKFFNGAAYMIYTSGSTGAPKGVEVSHKSLINYLTWANTHYYNNKSGYPTSLFTSLSSDLTITTLFSPLLRGDWIYVDHDFVDKALSNAFSPANEIKTLKITPSHINLLSGFNHVKTSVEIIIIGGEELLDSHIKILKNLNPDMKIYNEYGPTECTVGCIVEDINNGHTAKSIGKPIQNTCIYILDDNLNLQSLGIPGEIYIAGEGLADGYYNRPELTKKSFIPVPFENPPYPLMYRTGDVGLWKPDGYIEYLGRKDNQIKIKGYRIELGEIETVLENFQGVSKAIVTCQYISDKSFLVAYVQAVTVNNQSIKQYALERLPEYMVPEYYIAIKELPLATSGKIDKSKLPQFFMEEKLNISPANTMEEKLLSIWFKVLGVSEISVEESFFEAGGNSISILKIHKEIVNEFGPCLSVIDLFKFNSIRRQSDLLKEKSGFSDLVLSQSVDV